MNAGDWIAVVGIVIAILAIAISLALYTRGQRAARRHDLDAARALLNGALAGMVKWGDIYFATPYTNESIEKRAEGDRALVMEQKWQHIYEVPTEPVAALVSGAAASTWIDKKTIEAAGVALWQMRLFNELVRQHTDLGRQHFAEIFDPDLPPKRREAIATAAYMQSRDLHRGISNAAGWYPTLTQALEADIADIDARLAATHLARSVRGR
jgi:hypothetical protein